MANDAMIKQKFTTLKDLTDEGKEERGLMI